MSDYYNSTCSICGKKYHSCDICEKNKGTWHSWRTVVDTEDCFKIFSVLYDRRLKKISDKKAKEKLQKCDLTGDFADGIKEIIDEIMKVDLTENVKDTKEVIDVEEPTENVEQIESDKEIKSEITNTVIDNKKKKVKSLLTK